MTVVAKPVPAQERRFPGGSEIEKPKEITAMEIAGVKVHGEVEDDQESWGTSSEETESPKSVANLGQKRWRKKVECLHSQILKIREEDSHLGEDSSKMLMNMMIAHHHHHHHHHHPMDVVIFSKPNLPSSPLSGKTTVKASN